MSASDSSNTSAPEHDAKAPDPGMGRDRRRTLVPDNGVMVANNAPRLIIDDGSDDDDRKSEVRRARRRPRVEHASMPPGPAFEADDDATVPPKRKPKKKKAKGATASRDHLAIELLGIVFLALAVLSLLALVSYSSADVSGERRGPVENWVGPGGAYVADVLTLLLGFGAVAVPAILSFAVVACFRPIRQPQKAALRVVATAIAVVALLTLLHALFQHTTFLPFLAGGLLGATSFSLLERAIAPLGACVVSASALFASALVALNQPLGSTTRALGARLAELFGEAREHFLVWREERRLLAVEQARHEAHASDDGIDEETLRAERLQSAAERDARVKAKAKARVDAWLSQMPAAVDEGDDDEPTTPPQARKAKANALAPLAQLDHKKIEVAPVGDTRPPRPGQAGTKVLKNGAGSEASAPTDDATPTVYDDHSIAKDPPWAIAEPEVDGKRLSLTALSNAKKPIVLDDALAEPLPLALAANDDDALVIVERAPVDPKAVIDAAAAVAPVQKAAFCLPPLNLLDYDAPAPEPIDESKLRAQADKLVAKFLDFGIEGRVREIRPGPVCTTYELVPAPGIKVSKIAALADDIAMAMEAIHVRIVAPIPGKGAVGIEIPNERRETVYLKEIVAEASFKVDPSKTLDGKNDKLLMALGKDIEGRSYFANLAEMPHVLVSGTTGSGKSVSVNAMICSMLYRATPEDVRFLMIDPKMLELSIYDGIPHLLLPPIIDSKKAAVALRWAVLEMERRYQLMSELGVRDMLGFNQRILAINEGKDPTGKAIVEKAIGNKPIERLPYIVIVIDEYADLLAVAGKDVEGYVMRLAQKARAAGLHVMLATQRPSVDVITGVIKANFPVRMGFRLASSHDSKTIINRPGAEKLLGRGDMLFMPPGTSNVVRVHGAFISEKELHRVVDHLKAQGRPNYDMKILEAVAEDAEAGEGAEVVDEPKDTRYDEAVAVVARTKKCSTSWLQRMMNLGYQRAARIVDRMEREGLVGPAQNAKGDREIFVKPEQLAGIPGGNVDE